MSGVLDSPEDLPVEYSQSVMNKNEATQIDNTQETVAQQVEKHKSRGNRAMRRTDYHSAIGHYTKAVRIDEANHLLYCNRAAAYTSACRYQFALEDAERCIGLKPDFAKGYLRKGATLEFLAHPEEAKEAYEAGLRVDPGNEALKLNLGELTVYLSFRGKNVFDDPLLGQNLMNHNKGNKYIYDHDFLKKFAIIKKNPNKLLDYLEDDELMDAITFITGIFQDLKIPRPEYKPPVLTDDQKSALECSDLGDKALADNDLDTALSLYTRAVELDPENTELQTAKGSCLLRMENYPDCIALCLAAATRAKETHVAFSKVAKPYAVIAHAYWKMGDLGPAKTFFERSFAEFKDADEVVEFQQLTREIDEVGAVGGN